MKNNGVAGFLGVQGCLRCQENEKNCDFRHFLRFQFKFWTLGVIISTGSDVTLTSNV